MIIDTHAHLSDSQFDADRKDVLSRAFSSGVDIVVEIADQESEWDKARSLAEQNPGRVFWTAGLHPHYAETADANVLDRLRPWLDDPRLVAIGEIGLDYFKSPASPAVQRAVFERFFRFAVDAEKPVVIHCREADKTARAAQRDLLAICRDVLGETASVRNSPGVLHCFQGHSDFVRDFAALGFFFGVDGPLTYPGASDLRALFKEIPLDRIVLETDSPYLPPQAQRGRRNEPALLAAVAEALSLLKNTPLDELHRQTSLNAKKLYRLPA